MAFWYNKWLFGIINGFLVAKMHFSPFIATLGMMYLGRGAALALCDGRSIRDGIPDTFGLLSRGTIGIIPIPIILMLVFLIIFTIIEKKTLWGKYVMSIGGNKTAAIFSGINVQKTIFFTYVIVAIFSAFAGVMTSSRIGAGDPRTGNGFEFDVIVAILLGGTKLNGGRGSMFGTFIGVMIIAVLGNGLNMLGILPFWQSIFKGLILVLTITMNNYNFFQKYNRLFDRFLKKSNA